MNTVHEIRERGFPYYNFDDSYLRDFYKLCNLDTSLLIRGKTILSKHKKLSRTASVFFPHMFGTKVSGMMSPLDAFNSDKLLQRAVDKSLKYKKRVTDSSLRDYLRLVSGVQCVSNFKPEVAKYLYDEYGNCGNVYDFSMGYGGRLVGFLASNCKEYVGVDVNKDNFDGYNKIVSTYRTTGKSTVFVECGSEDFCEYADYFDLAFSSPPYFNKEQYSNDAAQSYIKFPTYGSWLSGYLLETIKNCSVMIKSGGFFIINISDTNKFSLQEDSRKLCKEVGLSLVDTLHMELTKTMGSDSTSSNIKTEPIFVYRKV